jgi:hypothetical protein
MGVLAARCSFGCRLPVMPVLDALVPARCPAALSGRTAAPSAPARTPPRYRCAQQTQAQLALAELRHDREGFCYREGFSLA